MHICWVWNLHPCLMRDCRRPEFDILFLPKVGQAKSVCVCVMGGVLECNSSDEVTCWSLFKRGPEPVTSSLKHVSAPTITGTHQESPLATINTDINDLTRCSLWHSGASVPPGPALLFPCVWLCSHQPHLLPVNTTLGTISTALHIMLLTLLSWWLASRLLQILLLSQTFSAFPNLKNCLNSQTISEIHHLSDLNIVFNILY